MTREGEKATRAAAILAAAFVASSSAHCAPIECANIKSDLDRLACYDKEVGRTPAVLPTVAKGAWLVNSQKSELTDRTDVFATVMSDEIVNCGWNKGDKIRLTIRCLDNATSLVINTQCHMTSSEYNDYGDVTYRLDDEKARTVGMEESTNNRSLALWSGGRAIPVIKQMFGKSKMIVKMTPYGENPFTATFMVTGLEEAAKPVRDACGW